jgi:hypothetical protein
VDAGRGADPCTAADKAVLCSNHKRFVEYLLELSEGVTGRIIDVLRRAALLGRRQDPKNRPRSVASRRSENAVCRGPARLDFSLRHPKGKNGRNEGKLITVSRPAQALAAETAPAKPLSKVYRNGQIRIRKRHV